MTTDSIIEAHVRRTLSASPERVFDAWLDANKVRVWLATSLSGAGLPGDIRRVEIDARVGGRFTFSDMRPGSEAVHWGTYLEIERPRRLVFTWFTSEEEERENISRVTLTLEPDGAGCIATITHAMAAKWAAYRERTAAGWSRMLEASGREAGVGASSPGGVASGHGVLVGPDTIRFERRLPGPIERVWGYLTESEKRRKWLASGEMELRVGGRVEHVFRNSELTSDDDPPPPKYADLPAEMRMVGRVTACEPPRLLGYTWPETSGEESEVRFELTPAGDEVLLVVTHERLTERSDRIGVAGGWHTHLDLLAARLRGREPAAFWATTVQREADYEERLP